MNELHNFLRLNLKFRIRMMRKQSISSKQRQLALILKTMIAFWFVIIRLHLIVYTKILVLSPFKFSALPCENFNLYKSSRKKKLSFQFEGKKTTDKAKKKKSRLFGFQWLICSIFWSMGIELWILLLNAGWHLSVWFHFDFIFAYYGNAIRPLYIVYGGLDSTFDSFCG